MRSAEETYKRIAQLGARLNQEHELSRLLELILDGAIELLGAERGFVILQGDGPETVACARNMDRETLSEPRGKFSRSIATSAVASNAIVVIEDARKDPRWLEASSVEELMLVSVVAVPLRARGAIEGAIYLDNRHVPSAFGSSAQEALTLLADLAGAALAHARAHTENEEMRRRLEQSARLLELEAEHERDLATTARDELARARAALGTLAPPEGGLAGSSEPMRQLRDLIDRAKDTQLSVLIEGESGTGKGLVAREIHERSARGRAPFIGENMAAIPDALAESVLFGHAKGAFTGAVAAHKGLFEQADRGTIFLDEIAETPLELQKRLLRVLEERRVRRVGESEERAVDVRIVAATNRDLRALVAERRFREDLYFRLAAFRLRVPPLRGHRDDIPQLVERFSGPSVRARGLIPRPFAPAAVERLMKHSWPGNVRELRNVVERALMLCRGPEVAPADVIFDAEFDEAGAPRDASAPPGGASSPTDRQARILSRARSRGSTGAADVMAEEAISRATAQRDLADLVAMGLLAMTGRGSGTRYVPTDRLAAPTTQA